MRFERFFSRASGIRGLSQALPLLLVVLASWGSGPLAQAALKRSSETYPALDPQSPPGSPDWAPTSSPEGAQMRWMARPPRRVTNRITPLPRPATSPLTLQEIREAEAPFDPVPETQRGRIGARLQLVERILRDHGRAYDYRTTTLRELRAIEAKLTASAPRSVPVPVARAAPPTALPLPPPPRQLPAASLPSSAAPLAEPVTVADDTAPMVSPSEIAIGAEGASPTLSADLDAPVFQDAEEESAPVPALPF